MPEENPSRGIWLRINRKMHGTWFPQSERRNRLLEIKINCKSRKQNLIDSLQFMFDSCRRRHSLFQFLRRTIERHVVSTLVWTRLLFHYLQQWPKVCEGLEWINTLETVRDYDGPR